MIAVHAMSTDTVNARLTIALNDPSPCSCSLLVNQTTRGGEPDPTVYAQRDFAKKFIRQSNENDHIDDIGQLGLFCPKLCDAKCQDSIKRHDTSISLLFSIGCYDYH